MGEAMADGEAGSKPKRDQREYLKQWRLDNLDRSRELARESYARIRKYIDDFKEGKPCMDCGGSFPPFCMDFDHRDPSTKVTNVGAARSMKKVVEEIEKCDLVCANCHRIRTWAKESDTLEV